MPPSPASNTTLNQMPSSPAPQSSSPAGPSEKSCAKELLSDLQKHIEYLASTLWSSKKSLVQSGHRVSRLRSCFCELAFFPTAKIFEDWFDIL
eukprot:1395464-Pleurochrysis_carterae.AAC.1